MTYEEAAELLGVSGQGHVLRYWDQLGGDEETELLTQIASLNFDDMARMAALLGAPLAGNDGVDIRPAEVVSLRGTDRLTAVARGEEALRKGEVGVLLVAGGQGSRLGFDGPKGCLEIGPVSGATLFEVHARKILALERKFETALPFYIMTSRANDEPTRAFFRKNGYFGLSPERVCFFVQAMWPALDGCGRIILDEPGHIFMNPDGHGGTLGALDSNGVLADMSSRGLTTVFYFQVDNPIVKIADPAFTGLHLLRNADISVKVCAKRDPDEGLGVVVERGGEHAVVEYTELTHSQRHAVRDDGSLLFLFGSVAIHVFSLDFMASEATKKMPLHVAHKTVPFLDDEGRKVRPEEPNAYKFEKFIFDVLPAARQVVNLEFDRADEFSPVKNAEGSDSPATARRDMVSKCARWLETIGVAVPRGDDGEPSSAIEIDACYALGPEDLRERLPAGFRVEGDVLLKAE